MAYRKKGLNIKNKSNILDKLLIVLLLSCILALFCGCSNTVNVAGKETVNGEPVALSYTAAFYDNLGEEWLRVSGTKFTIEPNKVKEYGYTSEGTWTYQWTTSSVVSVTIDGYPIETCGSTVIFYDDRLERIETELPEAVDLSAGAKYNVTAEVNKTYSDVWSLDWWWKSRDQAHKDTGAKAVIIQSQNGSPICMFKGEKVSWQLCEDLPKTTEVMIDGMPVYIHRANFAIVDLGILG